MSAAAGISPDECCRPPRAARRRVSKGPPLEYDSRQRIARRRKPVRELDSIRRATTRRFGVAQRVVRQTTRDIGAGSEPVGRERGDDRIAVRRTVGRGAVAELQVVLQQDGAGVLFEGPREGGTREVHERIGDVGAQRGAERPTAHRRESPRRRALDSCDPRGHCRVFSKLRRYGSSPRETGFSPISGSPVSVQAK